MKVFLISMLTSMLCSVTVANATNSTTPQKPTLDTFVWMNEPDTVSLSGNILNASDHIVELMTLKARVNEISNWYDKDITLKPDHSFSLDLPKAYAYQEVRLYIKPFIEYRFVLTSDLHIQIDMHKLEKSKELSLFSSGVTLTGTDAKLNLNIAEALTRKPRLTRIGKSVSAIRDECFSELPKNPRAKSGYLMPAADFELCLTELSKSVDNVTSYLSDVNDPVVMAYLENEFLGIVFNSVLGLAGSGNITQSNHPLFKQALAWKPTMLTSPSRTYLGNLKRVMMNRAEQDITLYNAYFMEYLRQSIDDAKTEALKKELNSFEQKHGPDFKLIRVLPNGAMPKMPVNRTDYSDAFNALLSQSHAMLREYVAFTLHQSSLGALKAELALQTGFHRRRISPTEPYVHSYFTQSTQGKMLAAHTDAVLQALDQNAESKIEKAAVKANPYLKTRTINPRHNLIELASLNGPELVAQIPFIYPNKHVVIAFFPKNRTCQNCLANAKHVESIVAHRDENDISLIYLAAGWSKRDWLDVVKQNDLKFQTLWLSEKQANELATAFGGRPTKIQRGFFVDPNGEFNYDGNLILPNMTEARLLVRLGIKQPSEHAIHSEIVTDN